MVSTPPCGASSLPEQPDHELLLGRHQGRTVTLEWSPGRITYLLDGRTVGTTTSSVPSRPMRWILQTESNGSTPNPAVAGHVLIDWVTIHTWTG